MEEDEEYLQEKERLQILSIERHLAYLAWKREKELSDIAKIEAMLTRERMERQRKKDRLRVDVAEEEEERPRKKEAKRKEKTPAPKRRRVVHTKNKK